MKMLQISCPYPSYATYAPGGNILQIGMEYPDSPPIQEMEDINNYAVVEVNRVKYVINYNQVLEFANLGEVTSIPIRVLKTSSPYIIINIAYDG